jgi:hypothetical protein
MRAESVHKQGCECERRFGPYLHPVIGKPLPFEETSAPRCEVLSQWNSRHLTPLCVGYRLRHDHK